MNPGYGGLNVGKEEGVFQQLLVCGEKRLGGGQVGYAPVVEELGRQRGIGGQPGVYIGGSSRRYPPRPTAGQDPYFRYLS